MKPLRPVASVDRLRFGLNIAIVLGLGLVARAEEVEILRDPWGIPHVYAETDAGAFYGLGYATAADRGFQMHYALRTVQGRLSEVVGGVRKLKRDETSVDHDRKMRMFGFHRAAKRTASALDTETRHLLQAYSDGVNDWFREHAGAWHPLFADTGLEPERWTPADCLASWWHLGQFFATDGTRDLIAARNRNNRVGAVPARGGRGGAAAARGGRGMSPPVDLERMPPDDGPAVVKRNDVAKLWLERVERYAHEKGLSGGGEGAEGPKFSHAWVVGGERTTTKSAVLVSDPQTPVRNPSLFYEFHIQGKTFNARGMGVPGSPIILIGFTDRVAWGVTALGADQADLFQLETDREHPNQYRFDGEWRSMRVVKEIIKVKGDDPVEVVVRETHLGPVATAFSFARPADGEVALKRIPLCEMDRETIQGAVGMMRAREVGAFDAALEGWRFPSANMVFGDLNGRIGYRAVGAIPLRSRLDASQGRQAQPGDRSERDWREIIPYDLMPGVQDPASGFLYSGNHRPIESWYSIPVGVMTGSGGDTVRSWRLRERLEAKERFTPEEVGAIHYDSVNPARRDIVRLGLHLRDGLERELSREAMRALEVLAVWYRAGASVALTEPGSALALELNTFFRFVSTDLAFVYGGGESGLSYFLKTAVARIEADPKAELSQMAQGFIDRALASAWRSCRQKYGEDSSVWQARARRGVTERRLGYYESLDGFPGLDREGAVSLPALQVIDGGTIACQTAQSYTQWVPMHDPDLAQTILPIGQSEWPEAESRLSVMEAWEERRLHPSPLSRPKVEALGVKRQTLKFAAREP